MGLLDKVKKSKSKGFPGQGVEPQTEAQNKVSEPSPGDMSPSNVTHLSQTEHMQRQSSGSLATNGGVNFDRRSRARFVQMITNTELPLELPATTDDSRSRLALLCFNGISVELRDLFRILEGLHDRATKQTLAIEHIFSFYDWFEGFYGIITSIFDTEEDVLFTWLEKVGALKMENALAPKRRRTKKERTKNLCWDILELKMQFEKKADRNGKVNLINLVLEMRDEAEQLTSRVLMYMQTLLDELPDLLNQNFGFDERRLIEEAVINNFRATEPGKFVIMAYSRGILDYEKRNGFLEESLKCSKSTKNTVSKQLKRFEKRHLQLAEDLAIHPLVLISGTSGK